MFGKHGIVALVGRPNVGKSALFNRLTGKARAIVDDHYGLTRDRNYELAEWLGREYIALDTGGFHQDHPDEIDQQVLEQTQLAIEEADIIVMVVDAKSGCLNVDAVLADRLKKANKPVLLAVNKIDSAADEILAHDFWGLGLSEIFMLSAVHGRRVDELLDRVIALLPEVPPTPEDENDLLTKIAVVGRPNVGKSSLVNQILGQPRVVVSDQPGTTRDTVSSFFTYQEKPYLLLDTAGLRAKNRIGHTIERYAAVRALRAIEDTHLAVLLLDATASLTEQDERIAGLIHEAGRACIIAINKWDAIEKDTHTTDRYITHIRKQLNFLDYAPILTLSAKTGQRVDRLLELARFVNEQHLMRIKTSLLNQTLRDIMRKHSPPTRHGKPLKIKFMSQVGVRPPAFALFVNDPSRVHFAYLRHIKNQLRERFGLEGTPIVIMLRGAKHEEKR